MRTPRTLAVALAATAALTLSACGDDDGGDDEDDTTTTAGEDETTTTIADGEAADPDDTDGGDDEADDTDGDDEESSPERDAYVAAFTSALSAQLPPADEATVGCMSEAFVDTIGADALSDAGVDPGAAESGDLSTDGIELPGDTRDRLGDALGDCDIDYAGLVIEGITGTTPDPTEVECVDEQLDGDALDDALADVFVSGAEGVASSTDDLPTIAADALSSCGVGQ